MGHCNDVKAIMTTMTIRIFFAIDVTIATCMPQNETSKAVVMPYFLLF